MPSVLPLKTNAQDIEKIVEYLVSKAGWVDRATVRRDLGRHGDVRKLDAVQFIGFLERDGSNVKLTEAGRAYARSSTTERQDVLRGRLRTIPLYQETLTWIRWQELDTPTKADIANHWIDNHAKEVEGAEGDALTGAVIFFIRIAELAGLGKHVNAGRGREAHLIVDSGAVRAYVNGSATDGGDSDKDEDEDEDNGSGDGSHGAPTGRKDAGSETSGGRRTVVDPSVHINVQIHIAADATAETVEEIFKNMQKYVLSNSSGASEESG